MLIERIKKCCKISVISVSVIIFFDRIIDVIGFVIIFVLKIYE